MKNDVKPSETEQVSLLQPSYCSLASQSKLCYLLGEPWEEDKTQEAHGSDSHQSDQQPLYRAIAGLPESVLCLSFPWSLLVATMLEPRSVCAAFHMES